MVKFFIYVLLALGVGVFLSIKLAEDPGYVLVSFQGYTLEATLVTILITIIIGFVIFSGLMWLLKIINPLKLLRKDTWKLIFLRGNPKLATEKGLQLLMLGHWQESYKILVENAARMQNPVFNYLAASLAAYQRNDRLAWSYCLDQAEKSCSLSSSGIKNLKALLELKSGQMEQGLAILLTLKKETPDSPYILSLLKEIYLSVADWNKLEELLPEMKRLKVLDEKSEDKLLEDIILHKLEKAAALADDGVGIKNIWNAASKKLKASERVNASYLRKLLMFGKDADALVLLTRYLKQNWSDTLVEMLGRIESKDAGQQLLLLEAWVKDRPNNVVLMLTLGRVSLRNQLWGKAKEYFELALRSSKSTKHSAEINAELGRLLENLGEQEKSMLCYSKAIELMERKLPELPMPIKAR